MTQQVLLISALVVAFILFFVNILFLMKRIEKFKDIAKVDVEITEIKEIDDNLIITKKQIQNNEYQNIIAKIKEQLNKSKINIDLKLFDKIEEFYDKELQTIKSYALNPYAYDYKYSSEGNFSAVIETHNSEFKIWETEIKKIKNIAVDTKTSDVSGLLDKLLIVIEDTKLAYNSLDAENKKLKGKFTDLTRKYSNISGKFLDIKREIENNAGDKLFLMNGIGVLVIMILSLMGYFS